MSNNETPMTMDAAQHRADIQAQKEKRLQQKVAALYTPNATPPAIAAEINAAIEIDLAALRKKCQAIADGTPASTPVVDED